MDATLSVAATYMASGSMPYGLAWDGTKIWSIDKNTHKAYEHNMDATLSVFREHVLPSTQPLGIAFNGLIPWTCDTNTKINKHVVVT